MAHTLFCQNKIHCNLRPCIKNHLTNRARDILSVDSYASENDLDFSFEFFPFSYFDADWRGCEGLEILRVQQVAAVRRQHPDDPDGKPLSLTQGIRGTRTSRGWGDGRSLRSCPVRVTAGGGAALRGLAA